MVSLAPRKWGTPSGASRKGSQVSWYDESGARHRKLFTGPAAKKQAVDKCTELELAQHGGGTTGNATTRPGSLTIRDAGERWVRYVERELGRERTTWAHYEQQLRDHLCQAVITRHRGERQAFGDILAERVTAPDVEALKDALLAKLGAKMTGRLLTVARMLFNDIDRRGEIASNPARAVKLRHARRGEDGVEIPEKDQVRALVEAVSAGPTAPLTKFGYDQRSSVG